MNKKKLQEIVEQLMAENKMEIKDILEMAKNAIEDHQDMTETAANKREFKDLKLRIDHTIRALEILMKKTNG